MGAVYRAVDTRLGRTVAVKVMRGSADDNDSRRRFSAEAKIAAGLQHPGIPPIYDSGLLADGRPFLAMKLIEGDTLASLLRHRRTLLDDLPSLLATFENLCQVIAYAHSNNIIHRDLKPDNVMVGAFGEVQVMDWGLAKWLQEDECEHQLEHGVQESSLSPTSWPTGSEHTTWTR